ncbi:MAG: hypothetical protein J6T94_07390 [Bacteroidaceae bacterium]|nr:hypothetical protein [Bacteroidaceae bacterium]
MKRTTQIIYRLLLVLFVSQNVLFVKAQTLSSGYFLEGNLQRQMLNPAFEGEHNYIAFPLLGNINVGLNGNVGLSDFLYPYNKDGKKLTTFMSKTVDAADFLNGLPELPSVAADVDVTVLGAGFKAWGGYNTLRLSLHADGDVHVPKAFFQFAKEGFQHNSYVFSNLSAQALSYADLALGHSHAIGENLRIGATLHLLGGASFADVAVEKLELQMSETEWAARSLANAEVGVFGDMEFTFDEDGFPSDIEGRPSLSSLGFGMDVGLEYDFSGILEGLNASAALTRIGRIGWKSAVKGTSGEGSYEYKGLGEINPNEMDLEEELGQISEGIEGLVNLQFEESSGCHTTLAPSLRLGAEYSFPSYSKMSAAVLYTHDFNQYLPFNEARFFLNLSPAKIFEASLNVGFSTYGASFGWMLNFHPKGFALFAGTDYMVFRITPQGIPVNHLNANVCLGLNIPF